ncbi:folate family ECF transporter S component [Streptococcus dentiloxodontae]
MKSLVALPKMTSQRLVTLAMLIALAFIVAKFSITVIPNQLVISFTFIIDSVIGAVAGPVLGFFSLGLLDLLDIFLSPNAGNFIIWWTLMEAIQGFIYGFFFYKKSLSWSSKKDWTYVTIATLINMIFSVFILTPLLVQIYFGTPFWVQYLAGRWIKIFEIPLRIVVTMAVFPQLQRIPEFRKLMGLQ